MDEVPYGKKIPVLPPSLELTAPLELPNPSGLQLRLASLDTTKICFAFVKSGVKSTYDAKGVAKVELDKWKDNPVSIRALTSLTAEKGKPLWPASPDATTLDESTVVRDEVKDFDTPEGTIERRRVVEFQLCGPAPKITSATRFIVITSHIGHSEYYKPDYKDPEYAIDASDRRHIERNNQEERMSGDAMILIAITDGEPDLSL